MISRTKKLYLSRVDTKFDPDKDLALGAWCFIGAEDIYREWEKLDFADPFADFEKLEEADTLTRRLTNQLVPAWASKLNSRHNTNHSDTYWRFVLIAWLLSSVQALWLRFCHVQTFIAAHKSQEISVGLSSKTVPKTFLGSIDFQQCLRGDPRFNSWMTSLIMRALAPQNWTMKEPSTGNLWPEGEAWKPPAPAISNERKSIFGKLSRVLFGRLSFHSVPGVTWQKIPLSIFINLLPRKTTAKTYFSFEDEAIIGKFPAVFLQLLDGFLEATLPKAYGNDYLALEEQAARGITYPGRIFVGNFMPASELWRLEFAHAVAAGEKFVTTQHGSGYGTLQLLSWGAEFEYPYHAFLTWGWQQQANHRANFIPVPSPNLAKIANSHHETKPGLAMVTTKIDMGDVRLHGPRPSQWIKYRRMKLEFLKNLTAEPLKNLTYFSYRRGNSDLEDDEYITRQIPTLRVATQGLAKEMLRSRILLLDHPGTSMNEAMAANVPTVCYWNPETFTLCKQAEPLFAKLTDVGVLHSTPKAAAAHVNKHWDNVGQWWRSADVQAARIAWRDQYASSSRFYWQEWLRALWKL